MIQPVFIADRVIGRYDYTFRKFPQWEHWTSEERGSRRNTQCRVCRKWFHGPCRSCSRMEWNESIYCSEECWVRDGRKKPPEDWDYLEPISYRFL